MKELSFYVKKFMDFENNMTETQWELAEDILQNSTNVSNPIEYFEKHFISLKELSQKELKQYSLVMAINEDDGYESLYYKGVQIDCGCPINEGTDRIEYFKSLSEKYGFTIEEVFEMKLAPVTEEYSKELSIVGSWEYELSEIEINLYR